jgi:hypothetical protein
VVAVQYFLHFLVVQVVWAVEAQAQMVLVWLALQIQVVAVAGVEGEVVQVWLAVQVDRVLLFSSMPILMQLPTLAVV